MELEDETTQTSSPGGWQGRLSAFLHVHRGSRASSRKSSRASDASDLSELGGPWLNLPLLLLSSAANMDPEELDLTRESADVGNNLKTATTTAATSPSGGGGGGELTLETQQPRRRSIYNFPLFLRHQDAVETPDDHQQQQGTTKPETSPPLKKGMKTSGTAQSLHPSMAEDLQKPKRGSIIRRKHPTRSSIKIIKQQPQQQSNVVVNSNSNNNNKDSTIDVSILVTEASPESPAPATTARATIQQRQQQQQYGDSPTIVHVLVHRESEEYNQDDEEVEQQQQLAPPQISKSETTNRDDVKKQDGDQNR